MYIQRVFTTHFEADLANGLDKGLAFDVADRAADFGDDHVGICLLAHAIDKVFYFIGDMRDRLYGRAEISALPFFLDHSRINFACGEVGILVQILVDEALVVPKIEIRLRTILGHIDLSMLVGAHGTRVHVDVWVELLCRNLESARLEQPAKRSRRDPLAQSADHAAGHKDIFRHIITAFYFSMMLSRSAPTEMYRTGQAMLSSINVT